MALCGCLEMDTVLLVRPDGSGTLTETMLMGQMASQMMAGMGGHDGAPPADPLKQAITKEKLAKKAAKLGAGVTVKSARVVTKEDGRRGTEIVYAFTDLNKFKLPMMQDMDKGPGKGPGGPGGAPGQPKKEKKQEFAKLTFVKATALTPAKLTIVMPKPKVGEKGDKPPKPKQPKMDPQAKGMMKMMFAGMRIRLAVKIDGKIIKTNATHPSADGKGLTLVDFNFGKLIQDDEAFDKMEAMDNDMTFEQAKKKFNDPLLTKYIKFELNPKVEVQFK